MDTATTTLQNKNFPGEVKHYNTNGNKLVFETDKTLLEVTIVTGSIIRFRFNQEYFAPDFSYAIDPGFEPGHEQFEVVESETQYIITTSAVKIFIDRTDLKNYIEDLHGNLILRDENGYHWEPNAGFGGNYVYCSKHIQPDECFYGLGDKACDLNLRGKRFLNWGTDTYGFAKEQDPLYRNIPFYFGLHNGIAYGLFFDNSFQTFFDFGYENSSIASFWAEGGEMNYYFMAGPALLDVARNYTLLTGRPPLPPLWALGYHQSKWSYFPDQTVKSVAAEFRKRKIPCDVIHLDIDYMDGFRCFTWDRERFPDPPKLVDHLRKHGFETVVILDPGIKIDKDYKIYAEAFEKGYFCKRQDGDLFKGKVWPGDCHFPDFTNPQVRDWWAGLIEVYTRDGIHGIWNDMNEPAVFEIGTFPDDVRHHYDGLDVSHRRGHNVYGMQMARASREGLEKQLDGKRVFVLTRSGYAGTQRFAAVWTGDNIASWEHLWLANMQCQRLSISGISFCGSDIGGFIGPPDGELFVRYMQLAIFHPFFRGHSSNDHGNKEPWMFGETYESIICEMIELRYRFLPYIYSAFYQYSTYGTPMIRPLSFISQHEQETLLRMDEFGFGDHLLICPVKEPGIAARKMYLPSGIWFNYWNDKKVRGGYEITVDAPLNRFPFFVRSGAVVPNFPVIQNTRERVDELILHIYYSESRMTSVVYTDDFESTRYRDGEFVVFKFTVFGNRRQLRIICESEGNYKPVYKSYKIIIHGLPFSAKGAEADGKVTKLKPRPGTKEISLQTKTLFKRLRIFH